MDESLLIPIDQTLRKAKIPDWFLQHPYGRPRTDDIATLRTLAQMGIVQRSINLVLDQVLGMPWDILPKDGVLTPRVKAKIAMSKALLLKSNTNEETYFKELRKALTDYFEIGEGVLVKGFDQSSYVKVNNYPIVPRSAPAQLLSIQAYDASQFNAFIDDYGRTLGHWQFNFVRNAPQFFSPRELIVFRDQPTTYFTYGRSRVKQIQDMLEWVFSQIVQTKQFYKSGAVFQGFITTNGLNQTEQENLEKFVHEKFRKQKHKFGIFHGGKDTSIDFKPLMLDVKDLAFLDGLDFVQKFVISVFGGTPAELGITDAVNKSSAEQQSQVFQRKYRVLLDMIEYRTNLEIISEIDPEGEIEFQYIYDADPQVQKLQQDIAASQLNNMQITINEWRREHGLDPVEWGDAPIQIQRMQQTENQQNDPNHPEDNPNAESKKPDPQNPDDSNDPPKKKISKSVEIREEYLEDIEKGITDALMDSRLAKLFDSLVNSIANGLNKVMILWRKLVDKRISQVDSVNSLSQIQQITNVDPNDLATEIRDGIVAAYKKGMQLNNDIELGYSLDRTDRRALDYIKDYPLLIAKKVGDDVQNALKRELYEGMQKGESIPKLSKRIESVFETTKNRAKTIARTEVTNASTWGKINQIRNSGGKRWQYYATEDERTCPICMAHHLKIYSIDDLEFKPPLHPNCRCTILSVDSESSTAPFPFRPKMANIELEQDDSIVKILDGSTRKLAESLGISRQTVSNWQQITKAWSDTLSQ